MSSHIRPTPLSHSRSVISFRANLYGDVPAVSPTSPRYYVSRDLGARRAALGEEGVSHALGLGAVPGHVSRRGLTPSLLHPA